MAAGSPVILLHGLGRTARSLRRLAQALEARGHPSVCLDYPSRRHDVRGCAALLHAAVLAVQAEHRRGLAFVGHSMGGLVARVLAADPAVDAHAIVMLGSPNGGSEVAEVVYGLAVGRLLLGPALADLRTAGTPALPVPDCPVGIIAGTRSYLPLTSGLIEGPNDGLVSVERTRLAAADWIALDAGHTFLMNHPEVPEAVAGFIREGRFPTPLGR